MKTHPLRLPTAFLLLTAFSFWVHARDDDAGDLDNDHTITVEELNTDADTTLNPEVEVNPVPPPELRDDEDDVVVDATTEVEVNTDVDRILSELEEGEDPESSPDEMAEEDGADPAEKETADGGSPGDPRSLPAMRLEEAESVEGLDIQGEDLNRGLITINYDNVRLADMVRIFAQTSGANIIIPEGLDQPVSGNLNDVYWREALEVILEAQGFALIERKSGIYTITPKDQLAAEPLSSETIDLQYISADAALPAVQSLIVSSNASVTPLPTANVLIISETPQQLNEIKRVVKLVDRPRRQVFIEAKFVELNDDAIKELGINWQVLEGYTVRATGMSTQYTRTDTRSSQDAQVLSGFRGRNNTSERTGTDNLLTPGIDANERTTTDSSARGLFEGIVQGKNFTDFDAEEGTITSVPSMEQTVLKEAVLSASDFALTLSALQQLDGVQIVSNPKMLVANGQTATIHVGRNEPNIRAIPQGENATTFAYVLDGYIEIGVKLEVTPVISTEKNITVSIIPELSEKIDDKEVGEAGTTFPVTQIRRINTEFAVESGKTVAIGGLTRTRDDENVKKVPLLGDIPIIGKYLFTHTRTRKLQEEIIIFVSVKTAITTELDDREGIPEHGKLIHTWLDQNKTDTYE